MILVLLGPPGVGKGTQAKLIAEKYRLFQVSTGDILRKAAQAQTNLGRLVKEYMNQGVLVPDEVIISLIEERIKNLKDILFDGFPRNMNQAEALDKLLAKLSLKLDIVIYLEVSIESIIKRLANRLVCSSCGMNYHKEFNPPRYDKNHCDICKSLLFQREDDKPEVVKKRIQVYHKQTKELIDFYREKNLLKTVGGEDSIEEVFKRISKVINTI
jgi:adenylate kinase